MIDLDAHRYRCETFGDITSQNLKTRLFAPYEELRGRQNRDISCSDAAGSGGIVDDSLLAGLCPRFDVHLGTIRHT